MTTTINKAFNADLLLEELATLSYPVAELTLIGKLPPGNTPAVRFDETQHTAQEIIDITAIINNHDENGLTEDQQIQEAALIAINNGKDYLRRQYLNSTPNLSTIYTTLSNAVAGNTYLQQIMDNQIAVYQLETGADLSTINNNAQRARYIECVRRVIALLT